MRMTRKRRAYEMVRRLGLSRPCLLVTNGDLVKETANYIANLVMKETAPIQRIAVVYSYGGRRGDLKRLQALLMENIGKAPLLTVHTLAYKVLTRCLRKTKCGKAMPSLIMNNKQEEIARLAMAQVGIEFEVSKIDLLLKMVRGAKSHLFYPPYEEGETNTNLDFLRFYNAYEKNLQKQKAYDYEDLIGHAFALLRDNPWLLEEFRFKFRYFVVYNYQQLTYAQKCFLALLTGQGREIGLFGLGSDDYYLDNELFTWKNAINDFRIDYPTGEIIIGEAYPNTTRQIAEAAYNIMKNKSFRIEKNDKRFLKSLPKGMEVSSFVAQDAMSELKYVLAQLKKLFKEGIALNEIALVFYNPKYIGISARMLKEANIPYAGQTKGPLSLEEQGVHLTSLSMVKNQFFDYAFLVGLDMQVAENEDSCLNGIFAGITRALKKLYLTMAESRKGFKKENLTNEVLALFQLKK